MKPPQPKLWNRNFLLLWNAQAVSMAGSTLSGLALALWVAEATGSPGLVGALSAAGSGAALVFTPLAGAVADRFPRVPVLVGCDVLLGVLSLASAGAVVLHGASPGAAVALLFALRAASSAGDAFYVTAVWAATPDLVGPARVPAANAALATAQRGAGLLAKSAGGLAWHLLGAPLLLVLDGLTFFASAAAEAFLRLPPRRGQELARATLGGLLREARDGWSYVRGHPGLRAAVGVNAAVSLLLDPLLILLPFLVRDPRFLGAGAEWYGYLLAGFASGTLAGYWVAGGVGRRVSGGAAALCLAGAGLGLGALGAVHRPGVALATLATAGVLTGLFSNRLVSAVQTGAPPEVRGRALAVFQALSLCLSPLALGVVAAAAEALGRRVDRVFLGCGAGAAAVALWALSSPSFRDLLRPAAGEEQKRRAGA